MLRNYFYLSIFHDAHLAACISCWVSTTFLLTEFDCFMSLHVTVAGGADGRSQVGLCGGVREAWMWLCVLKSDLELLPLEAGGLASLACVSK